MKLVCCLGEHIPGMLVDIKVPTDEMWVGVSDDGYVDEFCSSITAFLFFEEEKLFEEVRFFWEVSIDDRKTSIWCWQFDLLCSISVVTWAHISIL